MESKGQYFILLLGHILHRKPRGHKEVHEQGSNSQVASMLSKTIPTDSSCFSNSEKKHSLTYLQCTISKSVDEMVKGQSFGCTGVRQVKMFKFC